MFSVRSEDLKIWEQSGMKAVLAYYSSNRASGSLKDEMNQTIGDKRANAEDGQLGTINLNHDVHQFRALSYAYTDRHLLSSVFTFLHRTVPLTCHSFTYKRTAICSRLSFHQRRFTSHSPPPRSPFLYLYASGCST